MNEKFPEKAQAIMNERFGHDALISLATTDGDTPYVRTVNSYYESGNFYIITDARSRKMHQIEKNSAVALCGDWFTAHGIGENLGYIAKPENKGMIEKLRSAFSAWYGNGHINEADQNTVILRIRLTNGVLFSHGTKYNIDFSEN